MKPNHQTIDVADFFKQQLENQAIEPPAYNWDMIQQNIPTYHQPFLHKWWLLNSLAALVILSTFLWLYTNHSKTPKQSAITVIHKQDISVKLRQPFNEKPLTQTINNKNTSVVAKNTQAKLSQQATLQQTIYYVEASSVGTIEKIEIMDSARIQSKKIMTHLIPNEYGYYEIDLQNLSPGKYWIIFYKKDGKQIIRQETFK